MAALATYGMGCIDQRRFSCLTAWPPVERSQKDKTLVLHQPHLVRNPLRSAVSNTRSVRKALLFAPLGTTVLLASLERLTLAPLEGDWPSACDLDGSDDAWPSYDGLEETKVLLLGRTPAASK